MWLSPICRFSSESWKKSLIILTTKKKNPTLLFVRLLKTNFFKKEMCKRTFSKSTIKRDNSMVFNLVLQVGIALKNDDLSVARRMSDLLYILTIPSLFNWESTLIFFYSTFMMHDTVEMAFYGTSLFVVCNITDLNLSVKQKQLVCAYFPPTLF